MMNLRIGHGIDVHKFRDEEGGNGIYIGGVNIPYKKELIAHSDGDVLLHALSDALLGAAGMGDIGLHFPDTDQDFSNIDSRILLRNVMKKLHIHGWRVQNVDATIIAQSPKMQPYIQIMNHHIAEDLLIARELVNVKATTTEKLGFIGRNEGIEAQAIVMIYKDSN